MIVLSPINGEIMDEAFNEVTSLSVEQLNQIRQDGIVVYNTGSRHMKVCPTPSHVQLGQDFIIEGEPRALEYRRVRDTFWQVIEHLPLDGDQLLENPDLVIGFFGKKNFRPSHIRYRKKDMNGREHFGKSGFIHLDQSLKVTDPHELKTITRRATLAMLGNERDDYIHYTTVGELNNLGIGVCYQPSSTNPLHLVMQHTRGAYFLHEEKIPRIWKNWTLGEIPSVPQEQ